jgi:hypothetical protein
MVSSLVGHHTSSSFSGVKVKHPSNDASDVVYQAGDASYTISVNDVGVTETLIVWTPAAGANAFFTFDTGVSNSEQVIHWYPNGSMTYTEHPFVSVELQEVSGLAKNLV